MKLKRIILILIISIIVFVSINFSLDKRVLSGNFTATEIRQIKMKMTLEEVQEILGQPFQITSLAGLHEWTCTRQKNILISDIFPNSNIREIVNQKFSETDYCCKGNKDDLAIKRVTLVYTRHVFFSRHHPMLWVHLDSNFQVESVYAKQYDGFFLGWDDPCIYSIYPENQYENKALFERNFK